MLSPAARHRQKILARQAIENAPDGLATARPESGPEATEYELLLAELGKDIIRLREIQSIEGKIALKGEIIATYDNHVDATLAASVETGKAVQDEIVATMMIWRFDIGDFARGLIIAGHVLRFGLAMPQHMQRKAATLIAEEVAEAALMANKVGRPFDLGIVNHTIELTEKEDMPDQVRAKLCKARARLLVTLAEASKDNVSAPAGALQAGLNSALTSYLRALELDKNCGVKKDIERLQSRVSTPVT